METATAYLPDGTLCVLLVDCSAENRPPTLVLNKDGRNVSIVGEQAVYDLLKLITSMPWGGSGFEL